MSTSHLVIAGSQSSPTIEGDWERGLLTMTGDSYPENSYEMFGPVLSWIEAFLVETDRPLKLELSLVYLNTSSIRVMMDIFDRLEEAHRGGRPVGVRWLYDPRNERTAEIAEEFKEDCTFPFDILADKV